MPACAGRCRSVPPPPAAARGAELRARAPAMGTVEGWDGPGVSHASTVASGGAAMAAALAAVGGNLPAYWCTSASASERTCSLISSPVRRTASCHSVERCGGGLPLSLQSSESLKTMDMSGLGDCWRCCCCCGSRAEAGVNCGCGGDAMLAPRTGASPTSHGDGGIGCPAAVATGPRWCGGGGGGTISAACCGDCLRGDTSSGVTCRWW